MSALREVSNLATNSHDPKLRNRTQLNLNTYSLSGNSSIFINRDQNRTSEAKAPALRSPKVDLKHLKDPTYCSELIKEVSESYLEDEKEGVRRFNEAISQFNAALSTGTVMRNAPAPSDVYAYYPSPHYLQYQPEVNEKMRMILIDWLVDVHLKFKLHTETFYLCVNLIDRYLSVHNTKCKPQEGSNGYVPRAQLQLVGVCAMLLAAKYEEIWPPEIKECVHISANTYSREEIITTERAICAALSFRLTVPTVYPFAARLWTVLEGEGLTQAVFGNKLASQRDLDQAALFSLLKHATCFYLEHAVLEYKCLQFTPTQVANAAVYLALLTLRQRLSPESAGPLWTDLLVHYSTAQLPDFRGCAEMILEYVHYIPTTKYQAVRRKYSSSRYGEIAKMTLPNQVPPY